MANIISSNDINKLQQHPVVYFSLPLLVVLYLANFILPDAKEILALITANTLITNTYVWNILTSCFYETNLLKLFSDVLTVVYVALCIEKPPNTEQFGLFFLFCILACTIGTSIYCFFSLLTTGKKESLYLFLCLYLYFYFIH